MSRNRRNLWFSIPLLLALPFLLFWQVWWPDPDLRLGFAYGDFIEQNLAMRRFVTQEWRAGRIPTWDPYTFGGQPLAASNVFETFYPLAFWQLLFADLPQLALELEAIVHLGLAGVFTFLFLRRLTGRVDAALVGGLAFSWGGLLTSWPTLQFWILEAMIWLPAGLWLLEEAMERRSLAWAAAAAVPYSFSILVGHGQTVLYSAYLSGAYLLWRGWRRGLPWRFLLKMGLLVALLTLGLSAVQWLPTVEQIGLSHRADWGYADVAQGFQPRELLGLLRPNLGEWSPLYVGWISLALALAALLWKRRPADVWFWGGVVVVALLLSLGGNGFLYPLAYRFLPGFSVFRHQERIAYLVSLGLVVLAAYGYAGLAKRLQWPRWVLSVVLLLVSADLYRANNGVILEPLPEEPHFAITPPVTFLEERLATGHRMNSEGLLPGDGNTGMVFRLRDVTGNNPVQLASYELLLRIVPEVRWWQLFNVDYVVTRRYFDFPGITLAADYPERDLRIHHLDLGGEPVRIVHEFEVMPDQEAAVWYTSDIELVDPMETAVLEVTPHPRPEPATGPESARLTAFGPQQVDAEVTLSAPGVVVFSEVAYPGWVAHANGKRVAALRAFGHFRAVALPAGTWTIEWRFRPLPVAVGWGVSWATALLSLMFFLPRRRRRSR